MGFGHEVMKGTYEQGDDDKEPLMPTADPKASAETLSAWKRRNKKAAWYTRSHRNGLDAIPTWLIQVDSKWTIYSPHRRFPYTADATGDYQLVPPSAPEDMRMWYREKTSGLMNRPKSWNYKLKKFE